MQRDYWYSAARHRARLEAPAAIGRTAPRPRAAPPERPQGQDDRGAGGLRPRHGGQPGALGGRCGQRAQPLSPGVVPAGPARQAHRRAGGDDRRRRHHPAGARLAALRRRRPGDAAARCWSARACCRRTCSTPTARASSACTSTHHAARDGSGVGVSTTNLMLLPGTSTPEALIASVKNGFYVTELIGFGVNGVTGDYSRGAAGLWIENGELSLSGRGGDGGRQPARDAGGDRGDRQRPGPARPHRLADAPDRTDGGRRQLTARREPMIIDSHCHLHDAAFADVRETLRVSMAHDVYGIVAVGCDAAEQRAHAGRRRRPAQGDLPLRGISSRPARARRRRSRPGRGAGARRTSRASPRSARSGCRGTRSRARPTRPRS